MKFKYFLNTEATYARVYRVPVPAKRGSIQYFSYADKRWLYSVDNEAHKTISLRREPGYKALTKAQAKQIVEQEQNGVFAS